MKNVFFAFIVFFLAFLSCRSDVENLQQIDQIIHLYIDSAEQDMLNENISGSYSTITMNDVYGITDSAPVSFSIYSDDDTVKYIEYLAGAKRILIDSSDVNAKIYQSKIALALTKSVTDSTTATTNDTLIMNYVSTPEIFRVKTVYYNNQLVFTKVGDEANIVKIVK